MKALLRFFGMFEKTSSDFERTIITRRLFTIAWPLSVNTLIFWLLTITDSIFIGHYDPKGIDILNVIMMPFLALNQLVDYMHIGTVIPATQALGAKKSYRAQRIAENGFFVYGIVGIIFWLFWFFGAKTIYSFLTPDPNTQSIALSYIKVVSFTYLVQGIGYKGIQSVFATTGFTKPFLISGIVQVFVNILLNRVLIYGDFFFPELGIAGAAWGTLISSTIGALVMLYYLIQQKALIIRPLGVLRLNKKIAGLVIRMGFPVGFDMILWGLGGNFLVWIINHTDANLNRFMFFFLTLPEFSYRLYSGYIIAITNLVGRAFGAHKISKIFRIFRLGLRDAGILSVLSSLIYVLFPVAIAMLFTTDPETISVLKIYIPLLVLITIPRTLWEVFNGVLHGLGITMWGVFVQIIGLSFIVIQSYYYVGQLHWGVLGIFLVYTVDEVLRIIFMGSRLLYAKRRLKLGQKSV